ncbi:MAG: FIST C-terminal domain-containing protein, partial [Gammaproteobacteria bacterium]|nr:FIST C-terminal domain-containing protein [Gammaproteobacteria bacterium]
MDRFVHASGAGDDWRTAVDACIRRTGPAEGAANLGFVYVTDVLAGDLPSVLDRLKAGTGIEHWVGTVGMGICGTAAEFYDVPAISVLLCRFPEESFRIFSAAGADVEADALGAPPSPHQTPFGIVHGDPRATGLAELIDSLSRCMGNAFLVGGLTSSRDRFLSVADTVVEKPLSGVFFSDSVAVATRLTQGCSPLGQRHLVTHCDENLIYALDNTPATEVLRQDIGPEAPDDWHQIARLVFAGLPVKGSDTGDYLVRNIVGVDARHGVLAIADVVAPGDSLIFC